MDIENIHSPGQGKPKHSTQIISLFVGAILFILGLCGILFSGFAGLHLSAPYSTIIATSGVILFYNGYKDRSRDAFLCCFGFTLFFGLHAIVGWIFGKPGIPSFGLYDHPDPKWIKIIPGVHELGKNDHVLNTILALVLLGGTIDWWRRNTERGKRSAPFREIIVDRRTSREHRNEPLHH